jgi:hypothetical protein
MFEYLPKVNGRYALEKVKVSKKLLEVTTVSDEALVMWILHCYVATWEKEVSTGLMLPEDTTTDEDEESTQDKKSSKKQGKHHSVNELSTFMEKLEKIDTRRKDLRAEAQSWEDALMVAAIATPPDVAASKHDEAKAKAIMKTIKKRAQFIMPYT